MDEAQLVARSKTGDHEAFRRLFSDYYPRMVKLVYALLRNPATAEDVVQEAFLQAYRSMTNIRDGEPFGPWFYLISVRLARRHRRRTWRDLHVSFQDWFERDGEPADPAADQFPDQVDLRERLWEGLASLSAGYREVVVLRYLADLSEEAVAKATELPLGTVKSRLYRARRMLIRRLSDDQTVSAPDASHAAGTIR